MMNCKLGAAKDLCKADSGLLPKDCRPLILTRPPPQRAKRSAISMGWGPINSVVSNEGKLAIVYLWSSNSINNRLCARMRCPLDKITLTLPYCPTFWITQYNSCWIAMKMEYYRLPIGRVHEKITMWLIVAPMKIMYGVKPGNLLATQRQY